MLVIRTMHWTMSGLVFYCRAEQLPIHRSVPAEVRFGLNLSSACEMRFPR
jgi:hypothetical protein